jgi:WD40 repeat protein
METSQSVDSRLNSYARRKLLSSKLWVKTYLHTNENIDRGGRPRATVTTKLRIFISSPGDVAEERALSERVFQRLSTEFADRVTLEVVLWEHEPLFGHTGFQEQIERPSLCDLVVSILWSRLGTRLPSDFSPSDGNAPPTGTEFEIRDALDAFQRFGKPNLLIYRKSAAPNVNLASNQAEERLRQFRLLEDFCRHTFYDQQGAVLVAHHVYAESYEFERKLTEHVRKWLERQVGEASGRPRWTSGSPYRGLDVFEAEHKEIYFGRSEALSELTKRMRSTETRALDSASVTRFLLVQGMSGNGKSSLIRAGLLPLLEGRALEGIGLWRHALIKPSDRSAKWPEAGVAGALAEVLIAALPTLAETYLESRALADRLSQAPQESAARLDGYLAREAAQAGLRSEQIRLVLFVDQLEEIFAQSQSAPERSTFLGILQALAREGRIWIVATLRSDFAARLEEHTELVDLTREGHVYLLASPHPDELADMICEPARAAGLEWAQRDGVSLDLAILREATANPESLPLLEYALDQLYERREGRRLTYVGYEALGGLKGGIAGTAERVMEKQGAAAVAALPKLFRNLASVDENGSATRRYAPLNDFAVDSPERKLLDALIARRLCVTDRRGAEPIVSFAHEALILSWPRIQEWLQVEAGLLLARDALISEAHGWEYHGERDDWLVTAPDRLASLRAVVEAGFALPESARRFAAQSARRARRGSHIRQIVVISMGALAVAATLFGFYFQRERNKASHAIAAQFEAKAWDLLHRGEILPAVRYDLANALTGNESATVTRPVLLATLLLADRTRLLTGHTDLVRQALFSPDGQRAVTASEDRTARIWDVSSGKELIRLPHSDKVWFAAFSPDGLRVVTASGDNAARVWDTDGGKVVTALEHGDKNVSSVLEARFSPDGQRIITVSSDGTAWLWATDTGRNLARFSDGVETLEMIQVIQSNLVTELRHSGTSATVPTMTGIVRASFSPNGRALVTASANGIAQVWDTETAHLLFNLKHDGPVSRVAFSPDGQSIATTSKDHTARVWGATDGRELVRLNHDAPVSEAAFSPDGRELVTACDDGTARIWDVSKDFEVAREKQLKQSQRNAFLSPGIQRMKLAIAHATNHDLGLSANRELARLPHEGKVNQAMFSADGRMILTASEDRTARIWEAYTGRELARLEHGAAVQTAIFSQDNKRILTSSLGNSAQVWDVSRSLGLEFHHDANVQQAVFSHDGSYALTSSDDHTASVWDTKTGRRMALLHHDEAVRGAVFSADDSRIVTISGDQIATIWDLTAGSEIGRLRHSINKVRQASFSPDGRRVITAGEDLTARIWDVATQRELWRLTHLGIVNSAVISPDGTKALTGSVDRTARIWDMNTGHELARLKHEKAVRQAAFSTDGRLIVTASDDHTARIWDAVSGREMQRLNHGDKATSTVLQATFSLDGDSIVTASSDGTARVWDVATGHERARFRHEGPVLSAVFSPDGRRVVTASNDHTARIWDVSSGRELLILQRANLMRQAAFSPDGKRVLTAADDTARVWDVPSLIASTTDLNQKICTWLPSDQRQFSSDEIESDPLVRDVFLAAGHDDRSVCVNPRQ